jgi:nicotinate-nucleotide adenylyltransferase
LAIEANPKLFAKNIEFKLPRPSYTSNTLAYLVENYKNYTFSIIMGSDGFSNITSWHNFEYLIDGFEFIIYEREGFPIKNSIDAKIKIVRSPLLNISATLIRNKIKKGLPIDYWVPEVIAEEIKNQGYYKSRYENPLENKSNEDYQTWVYLV